MFDSFHMLFILDRSKLSKAWSLVSWRSRDLTACGNWASVGKLSHKRESVLFFPENSSKITLLEAETESKDLPHFLLYHFCFTASPPLRHGIEWFDWRLGDHCDSEALVIAHDLKTPRDARLGDGRSRKVFEGFARGVQL